MATTTTRATIALSLRTGLTDGTSDLPGRPYNLPMSNQTGGQQENALARPPTEELLDQLERHGWAVLHDLAIPGSRANLDHLVIGPGGVFVIDSKQYRGRLQLDPTGRLWHGRHSLAPTLRAVDFEADQAAQVLPDPGVAVVPIVAVHGAQVPWGKVVTDGVRSWQPGACQACFVPSRQCWGPSGSPGWPTRPESASTLPADRQRCRTQHLSAWFRPSTTSCCLPG
jgi:hypothetical protein